MAESDIKYVKHKRSDKVDMFGNPFAPKPESIGVGEIVMNYAKGSETLFIKNSDGEIVAMPTRKDIAQTKEQLNDRIDTQPTFSMKVECDDGTIANFQILGGVTEGNGYGYGYGYDGAEYYNIGEWDDEAGSLDEHTSDED